ncbi:MAG: hypothetical protein LBD24_03085 [Spirochaetaceae bacterium]|nr:hypothetical protein [Spirochaetaceae bacterium]
MHHSEATRGHAVPPAAGGQSLLTGAMREAYVPPAGGGGGWRSRERRALR